MSFVIFALPRSRTAWLSRFLTYGGWSCGHDEIRHMRSLDDVRAWFSQPCVGTVETAGAPWWRLLERFAPGAQVAVVRRPVEEVVESVLAVPAFRQDRAVLTKSLRHLDRKLGQLAARLPGVLSVRYSDLADEAVCASVFEHCLPFRHDHAHWARLDATNVQVDAGALVRYVTAYRPALDRLALIAKQQTLAAMARRAVADPAGITFQAEPFDSWLRDAQALFDEHLVLVGEAPGDWKRKNIPLMRRLDEAGAMQVMTARCNGRMFGYLMTVIAPSLTGEGVTTGSNTTFYASPDFPGLGMKLQRAAIRALAARGVDDIFLEAGTRGDGPRLGAMYRRLGAADHGHVYRLQLKAA